MPKNGNQVSLARSLGAFFGHIVRGITADPAAPETLRRESTTHEQRDTPAGKVVVRRTVIEEVVVPKDAVRNAPAPRRD